MKKQRLLLEQLDKKINAIQNAQKTVVPSGKWLHAIRNALGMTLEQFGNKMGISKQGAKRIESSEAEGSISINKLRQAAQALDMELVYGFVPRDGSLDALIERKARELATQIVARTSNTMKLEDQENSKKRIKKAIEERTAELKRELPKSLWD